MIEWLETDDAGAAWRAWYGDQVPEIWWPESKIWMASESDQQWVELIERAQQMSRPRVREAFLAGVDRLRDALTTTTILDGIADGDVETLLQLDGWAGLDEELLVVLGLTDELERILTDGDLAELADLDTIAKSFLSAGRRTIGLSPIDGATFSVEELRERTIAFLDRYGASQITRISTSTRDAVREILKAAQTEGQRRPDLVRALVSLDGEDGRPRLGLDRVRQAQYERFVDAVLDPSGEFAHLSPRRVQQELDREYNRLLKRRARLIAHQESHEASIQGQMAAFEEAVDSGALSAQVYVLVWITRLIRVCKKCQSMAGAWREIDGGEFHNDPSLVDGDVGELSAEKPDDLHIGGYCVPATRRRSSIPEAVAALTQAA